MRSRLEFVVTMFALMLVCYDLSLAEEGGGAVASGTVHRIPYLSSNNAIELSIVNTNAREVPKLRVEAIDIPPWLHYDAASVDLLFGLKQTGAVAMFEFSLEKSAPVGTEQDLRFEVVSPSGQRWPKNIRIIVEAPARFELFQNYPNPFNPSTVISYTLPAGSRVTLTIYNLLGQLVTTLVDAEQSAGFQQETWEARNISNGVYFYELAAIDQMGKREIERKRLVLLK